MTPMNIIVISVKKNEIQNIGSIIVQIVVILHIPNVFLGKTQMPSNTCNGHLFGGANTLSVTHTSLCLLRKQKTTLDVIVLVKSWFTDVPNVISTCTIIVHRKGKCCFNFYSIPYLVHKIFGREKDKAIRQAGFLVLWLNKFLFNEFPKYGIKSIFFPLAIRLSRGA